MATHSSILVWRIPWTEEPGGLQSMGSQRVRHNRATNTTLHYVSCSGLVISSFQSCFSVFCLFVCLVFSPFPPPLFSLFFLFWPPLFLNLVKGFWHITLCKVIRSFLQTVAYHFNAVERWSPTFLTTEDNFSMDGGVGGRWGSGDNVSNGEQQIELYLLAHYSYPVV